MHIHVDIQMNAKTLLMISNKKKAFGFHGLRRVNVTYDSALVVPSSKFIHPLEVVSHHRDPQLQVNKMYSKHL